MGRPLPDDLKVAVDILVAELKVRLKGDKVRSEKLLWDDETAAFDLPPHAIVFQLELSSGRRMLASVLPWGLSPEFRYLDGISDHIKNASEKAKIFSQAYPGNCPTPPDTLTAI
ncbi:MAG: hypothetical protein D4R65_13990 [Verrucomicrobiaceae bacterium]|nr:MAG: hypothetical protein D4R65_13990 [Verrucomicrobiaceae bacterium]